MCFCIGEMENPVHHEEDPYKRTMALSVHRYGRDPWQGLIGPTKACAMAVRNVRAMRRLTTLAAWLLQHRPSAGGRLHHAPAQG